MIELEALVDMPWKSLKKGDRYSVPDLIGLARSEIKLKQASVVGSAPAAEPAVAMAEVEAEDAESPGADAPVDESPRRRRRRRNI